MKRILIVYHYFALYRLPIVRELMGLEDYEFTLVSADRARRGIRTIDPELAKVPVSEGGVRWKFVENQWVGGSKSPFLWQRGLNELIEADEYDAVVFLGAIYFLSTWVAIRKAKQRGKRVLIWTHGFLGKDPAWQAAIRHKLYQSADACLLYGNKARDIMLAEECYDPSQLFVLYNSLDHQLHSSKRDYSLPGSKQSEKLELFGDSSTRLVTYIGRLSPDKSLHLLIEALAIAKQDGNSFKVLLIGEGALRADLEAQARQLNVEDEVLFYGYCEDEDTACRLLAAGDVCVVPGGVGLTGMHAMGVGIPVISHDDLDVQKPECEAIVNGKTGRLFKRGNARSLADMIVETVSDQSRLFEMRQNCFKMMDSFYNPKFQAKVICDAIDGVPNSRSGQVPAALFN